MTQSHRRRFDSHVVIGGMLPDDQYHGINWNYRAYQDAVEARLLRIRDSQTGRIVLNAMTKQVLIAPRLMQDGNAETRAVSSVDPSPFSMDEGDTPQSDTFAARDGTMDGAPLRGAAGDPRMRGTLAEVLLTGSGQGTDVVIEFTPGFHAPSNALAQRGMWTGRSVELLMHELVHAMMAGRGLSDPRPLAGTRARYSNRAEFNAVLVTNIFRSEVTPGAGLRDSHRGRFDEMSNPAGFYAANRALVEAFCNKVPAIARQLARVQRSSFNPCKTHLVATPVP